MALVKSENPLAVLGRQKRMYREAKALAASAAEYYPEPASVEDTESVDTESSECSGKSDLAGFSFSPASYYVNLAFTSLKPLSQYKHTFYLYQELYHLSPESFRITAHIHSNSVEDTPHISVTYQSPRFGYRKFHINGNIIKNAFHIRSITVMLEGKISTIAEF